MIDVGERFLGKPPEGYNIGKQKLNKKIQNTKKIKIGLNGKILQMAKGIRTNGTRD